MKKLTITLKWFDTLTLKSKFLNYVVSTHSKILIYDIKMENFLDSSSSISPFIAILWCFYPIGILVLFEILLGGGIDDDNDDQDGGMLIPAYATSKN